MKLTHFLSAALFGLALLVTPTAIQAQNPIPYTPIPDLGEPKGYEFDGTTIHMEISQFAGYCGLVLANGGLKGSEDSYLYKKHKIKLDLVMNEIQDWSRVQTGKIAIASTTADVISAYRNKLRARCMALIDYSRGADEFVALKKIRSMRDLIGKTVVVTMFDDTEFLVRKLSSDNSLEVHTRDSLASPAAKDKVNLLFAPTTDAIPAMFAKYSADPTTGVAACVTWIPFSTQAVDESKGRAHVLMTNKNQLYIADVLIANLGFCEKYPHAVKALNDGLMQGNQEVMSLVKEKTGNDARWDLLVKSLSPDPANPYDRETLYSDLTCLEFATARLNAEFLGGKTRVGAGLAEIMLDASKFYDVKIAGPESPFDFVDPKIIADFTASSFYNANEPPLHAISSDVAARPSSDDQPTVKRNFFFHFNLGVYDRFDMERSKNAEEYAILERAIKARPGSIIRLIGHLDPTKVRENGQEFTKKYTPMAKEYSVMRAETVKQQLLGQLKLESDRIESSGLGWEKPLSQKPQENARVEVEIFALE